MLLLFSILIIYSYYSANWFTFFTFFTSIFNQANIIYISIILVIYSFYKIFQIYFWSNIVKISFLSIVWYFLLHLFVISVLFFHFESNESWSFLSNSFILFFQVLIYSIVPILILFITTGFGYFLQKKLNLFLYLSDWSLSNNKIFNFIISLALGFFSFMTLIIIFWLFKLYNIYIVVLILSIFTIISFSNIKAMIISFLSENISFDWHNFKTNNFFDKIAFHLLSTEFLFIIASLIFSVSLISIIRPMPIWWDDLGVYMNYPRQLAYLGDIGFLSWMYTWQVFTWIGFMISEPVQAFYLNNVGGFLSFILIILVVSDLLKTNKKTFINIPLLVATIFISLPMIIFQQAKDMKLDPALFSFSLIVLYLFYKVFFDYFYNIKNNIHILWFLSRFSFKNIFWNNTKTINNNNLALLFVIGLLAWFVFSIKVTSLILILSLILLIFYIFFWWFGLFSFIFLFVAIFTKLWLFSYLNLVYDKSDIFLINFVSIISLLLSILFFIVGFYRYWVSWLKILLKSIIILLLWIFLAILPWVGKNIYQTYPNFWFSNTLFWKSNSFVADYLSIYSNEELEKKNKDRLLWDTDSSWISWNEDWWRYFWYETWLNNYFKLAWNLTMQVNQKWEFTNISWIFLAFIPSILLFLKYRRKNLSMFIFWFIILELLFFLNKDINLYITENILSKITLPIGYFILFFIYLLPVLFMLFSLENNKINKLFKLNLIFIFFYTFLWAISSYWVVWYWIMMYFWFLLMISIWLYCFSSYSLKWKESDFEISVKFYSSIVLFSIFSIWFIFTTIPYSISNLRSASYASYKNMEYNSNELIFNFHSDYLNILFNLNIKPDKKKEFLLSNFDWETLLLDENIKNLVNSNLHSILNINEILNRISSSNLNGIISPEVLSKLDELYISNLQDSANRVKSKLYKNLLKPNNYFISNEKIYRVWTFLKYFIVWNEFRILEDSLIFDFYNLILWDNVDKTIDNMKKLGLKYLLIDLNAATIDRSFDRKLTNRYEKLLVSFLSSKLSLIETDSVCLNLALDRFNKGSKTKEDVTNYIFLAWVNYNSSSISRDEKLSICSKLIYDLLENKKIDIYNYKYLLNIKSYYDYYKSKNTSDQEILLFIKSVIISSSKALFEIK